MQIPGSRILEEFMLEVSMKPFFALLYLALLIVAVTAEVPNDPSKMKAVSEASELLPNTCRVPEMRGPTP